MEYPERFPKHRLIFWGVVVFALALRIARVLNTWILGTDGESYLWMAEDWRAGRYQDAVQNRIGYHPFYPAMVAYASYLTGGLVSAAFSVSVFFASLTVFPIYWLVRDIWNARVAVLTLLLYAVQPRFLDTGSDAMTEGTFFFFFFSAVTCFWFALRGKRPILALVAGLCGAASYMTRVEGIYILLGAGAFTLASAATLSIRRARRPIWGQLLMLVLLTAAFLAASSPFLLKIKERTGRWYITMKGSVPGAYVRDPSVLEGFEYEGPREKFSPERLSRLDRWKKEYGNFLGASVAVVKFGSRAAEPLWPLIVLGALLAVFYPRLRGQLSGGLYLLMWALGFFTAVFLSLMLWRSHVDARYFLGGWLCLFPWGALALLWILERLHSIPSTRWRRAALACVFLLLGALGVGKAFRANAYDQLLVEKAGDIVRGMVPPGVTPRVMATRPKFSYYAGSLDHPWPRRSYEYSLAMARHLRLAFLVGFRQDFETLDPKWFQKVGRGDLEPILVHNPDPENVREVLLFRIKDVPLSSSE